MHGKDAVVEEILDWRPYDYVTYRITLPTPMGLIRFLATTEFEPTPGGTILHQRFAAPKTPKERAIMEQMLPWIAEAVRTSTTHLTELLDEELERRGRDAIEEPRLPQPRPDGPAASSSIGLPGGELPTKPRTAAIIALLLAALAVAGDLLGDRRGG